MALPLSPATAGAVTLTRAAASAPLPLTSAGRPTMPLVARSAAAVSLPAAAAPSRLTFTGKSTGTLTLNPAG